MSMLKHSLLRDNSRIFNVKNKSTNPDFDRLMDNVWVEFEVRFPPYQGKGKRPLAPHKDQFMVLMWDLYRMWAYEKARKRLSVHMHQNHYLKTQKVKCSNRLSKPTKRRLERKWQLENNPYNISYCITDIIKALEETRYVLLRKAIPTIKLTQIEIKQRLIDVFNLVDMMAPDLSGDNLIKLNGFKGKHYTKRPKSVDYDVVDYPLVPFGIWEPVVLSLNKLTPTIGCGTLSTMNTPINFNDKRVERVFIRESFELGGRFHGGFWQGMSKRERALITIADEKTIEVDIVACHISLIYLMEGLVCPADPYSIMNEPDLLDEDIIHRRKVTKLLVLCALNAESMSKAYKGFMWKARKINKLWASITREELQEYMNAFIRGNPCVEKYIGCDMGVKLMFEESKIANHVIDEMTQRSIVVLPIHDSFIVQRQHFDTLVIAMADAFKTVFGEINGVCVSYNDTLTGEKRLINLSAIGCGEQPGEGADSELDMLFDSEEELC
jgi:hypothetical protein